MIKLVQSRQNEPSGNKSLQIARKDIVCLAISLCVTKIAELKVVFFGACWVRVVGPIAMTIYVVSIMVVSSPRFMGNSILFNAQCCQGNIFVLQLPPTTIQIAIVFLSVQLHMYIMYTLVTVMVKKKER